MENKNIDNNDIIGRIYDDIYANSNEYNTIQEIITDNYGVLSPDDRYSRKDETYIFFRGLCYSLGLFEFYESNKFAKSCFEKVLKINPNNPYAIIHLAGTLCKLQKPNYTRAKQLYERVENKYSLHGLAVLYQKVDKDLEKAKELYKNAVLLGNPYSMNNLAQIYEKEQEYSLAIQLYEEAVTLNSYESMINLANLYYTQKDDFLRPFELATYVLKNSNNNSFHLHNRAQGVIDRIKSSYNPMDILKFNIKQRNELRAQKDENKRLQKEIVDLKKEFEELRQMCYMPGGIISKNCEKHFYETSEQVDNMDLE